MKSKNILFLTLLVLAVLVLIFSSFSKVFDAKNQNYVIKINEEKITEEEFLTYLFEQKKVFEAKGGTDIWETDFDGLSAIEVAKQNALNSIILVKTAVLNAEKLNIFITEEENASLIEEANELYKEVNSLTDIKLSLEMATKIIKENKIEQKVFEYITHNFELSEKDFELYFDDYFNLNKKSLTTVNANIIFVKKTLENADNIIDEIYNQLIDTINLSAIKANYPDVSVLENVILNEMYFEEKVESQIYSLDENSLSQIIEVNSGYYIFNILSIEMDNVDELKEKVKEEYILNKKQEIYSEQAKTWSNQVTITKNQEVWNKINTITDL